MQISLSTGERLRRRFFLLFDIVDFLLVFGLRESDLRSDSSDLGLPNADRQAMHFLGELLPLDLSLPQGQRFTSKRGVLPRVIRRYGQFCRVWLPYGCGTRRCA